MKYDAKAFRIFNIDMASLPKTLYRYMPEWPYALGTLTTGYFHFSLISELWIKQIVESGIKPEMYQASLDKTCL